MEEKYPIIVQIYQYLQLDILPGMSAQIVFYFTGQNKMRILAYNLPTMQVPIFTIDKEWGTTQHVVVPKNEGGKYTIYVIGQSIEHGGWLPCMGRQRLLSADQIETGFADGGFGANYLNGYAIWTLKKD